MINHMSRQLRNTRCYQVDSIIIFSMLILMFLSYCRKPVGFQQLTSGFTVVTHADVAALFSSYSTYFISDTVINLSGSASDTLITGSAAAALVATVKDNMNNRGYSFVPHTSQPDLGIAVCVLRDIRTSIAYYPGWWDDVSGYWDPLYWVSNNSYPYYYGWTTTYTYKDASLIVNLIDLKNAPVNKKLSVIWHVSGFNPYKQDSATNLQASINVISQAFAQSPYLKK